ncbi:hypothetical protein B0J11DRAFT_422276 [Dendryphion nanum]|uniref:Short-chain dehydrogenase/reductase family protein n=1 Tax=Dendryphion nanum TaxID=256645 RepID=A0A9P9EM92_9PLEO|nr:hypothetical protein B0J11DRAFT_422276 [Dendryphion nanum]
MAIPTQLTAFPFAGTPSPNLKGASLLRWGAKHPPIDPHVSFAGKTVLVTGANIGLGLESAVKFAQKGASKIILGVRSMQRGEEAKTEILTRSGRDSSCITIVQVDLEKYASVQEFVKKLEKTTRLDIALLNAGLCNQTYVRSAEGHEMAVQVNVLSTALMALLLLPLLRKTARETHSPTHMTFVNSAGHAETEKAWLKDSLLSTADDEASFDVRKSYMMVKLLGMVVMKKIARQANDRNEQDGVIVNACCPGLCRTNLGRNFSLAMKVLTAGFQFFTARTAEEGSRTLVGASALGWESHGKFWHHDVLFPMSDLLQDEKLVNTCWMEIVQALPADTVGSAQ